MAEIRTSLTWRTDRKKWRARYLVNGTWVTKQFPLKREAQEWLKDQITAVNTGDWVSPTKNLTVAEFAERHFWPTYTAGSPATIYHARRNYDLYIDPKWGNTPLQSVTKTAIRMWRAELAGITPPDAPPGFSPVLSKLKNRPLAPSYQRAVYFGFHKLIRLAIEDGFLVRNPFPLESGLPEPRPTKAVRYLSPYEVELLANTIRAVVDANPPTYGQYPNWGLMNSTLIYLLAYGGLRSGEARALRVNDVCFETGRIKVDEQLRSDGQMDQFSRRLKRPRSNRAVPLPADMMAILREHIVTNIGWVDPEALLFTTPTRKPLEGHNWRRRFYYPAVKAAGIKKADIHDLRHTAASAWFDEGFDLVTVARFLGDSLAVAERTYIHLFEGRHHEGIDRMGDRMARGRAEAAKIVPLHATSETG